MEYFNVISSKTQKTFILATVTYEDSEQSPKAIAQAITKLGYPATVKGAK